MEELNLLIEMVSKLPAMALWVLVGFWAYKVIVIGSIYGVIRFVVEKTHSWLTQPRHEKVEVALMLDGFVIHDNKDALLAQLRRIAGYGDNLQHRSEYVHSCGVTLLREALDAEFARRGQKPATPTET